MDPTTTQIITIATPIVVAALAAVGAAWGKRISRRSEDATVRKTRAEAVSIEVDTARKLLDEVRTMMAAQRADHEQRLADLTANHEQRMAATSSAVADLADQVRTFERRQRELSAALAAHAPWDEAAFAALNAASPGYPSPPPLYPTAEETR